VQTGKKQELFSQVKDKVQKANMENMMPPKQEKISRETWESVIQYLPGDACSSEEVCRQIRVKTLNPRFFFTFLAPLFLVDVHERARASATNA